MAKIDKPPVAPNLSRNLADFKLNKSHKALLERFDEMQRYMEKAGRRPPCMRLARRQFVDIDACVLSQSQGKRHLKELNWRGFPILSTAE